MPENTKWWQDAVFYQIYPRSFFDSNGDGDGDIPGITAKLDYIKSLGVDAIWSCPYFVSPKADNGYDVADYRDIDPSFGTLDDWKEMIKGIHRRGMRFFMDLVVNHTSDEHPWFLESKKSKDNPYSDYYIWRDKPNNWDSLFEGEAWEYVGERDQYYLHIFAKKQPDLNMDNPKVRQEVKDIMRFWLDMGVDGFREDVINFISKKEGLPNGLFFLPAAKGMSHYKDGPHIHEYLSEFRKVCDEYDCFQLGEGPMTTVKSAMNYLTGPTKSLDMMFSFDHMMADCLYTEYIHRPFSLVKLKKAFTKWQKALDGKGWNALYMENHDHPRIISRYGSEHFHRESGTMLAACYLFQQGTPFIYQGQEIGMTNIKLMSIDQYVDVSSITNYHTYHLKEDPERRLHRIHLSSRDSARTPMQWNATDNAGFSKVKPWFYINPNYKRVNVAKEEPDNLSILNFYRKCLSLRKSSETLIYGQYTEHFPKDKNIYMYERSLDDESYLVICSFSRFPVKALKPKKFSGCHGELVLCNYPDMKTDPHAGIVGNIHLGLNEQELKKGYLRPYETRVYRYIRRR
jgi:oligo-1,6-glucosidase